MPAANSSAPSAATAAQSTISDRVINWPYGDINGAHSNVQSQAPTPTKMKVTTSSSDGWIPSLGGARPAEATTASSGGAVAHAMEGFNAERMLHWPFIRGGQKILQKMTEYFSGIL